MRIDTIERSSAFFSHPTAAAHIGSTPKIYICIGLFCDGTPIAMDNDKWQATHCGDGRLMCVWLFDMHGKKSHKTYCYAMFVYLILHTHLKCVYLFWIFYMQIAILSIFSSPLIQMHVPKYFGMVIKFGGMGYGLSWRLRCYL